MVEESSPPLLPSDEESIEPESDTALEPEPESRELPSNSTGEPGFVCACEPLMHSACAGLPFYDYHEGKRYCVLHYPSTEKSEDFYPAFSRKISAEDFDFRGVFFPGYISLSDRHFNDRAVFISATFAGEADFSRATFKKEAYFSKARFRADGLFKRKRSCCSKPFSVPCKVRCSRSPFDASSCTESKLVKETPKGLLYVVPVRLYRHETPTESALPSALIPVQALNRIRYTRVVLMLLQRGRPNEKAINREAKIRAVSHLRQVLHVHDLLGR
jgi:hypothetical protein